MLRVVAGLDGPRIDAAGPGRGAYLHPAGACLDEAIRSRTLAKALRAEVSAEGAARLGVGIREREAH